LLWVFTTTGGRQVFVEEVLAGAYDSQAEHFLHGDVDVDVEAIGPEAMIVNDHVRMYFGPFPAFLRIPLNFLYPAGHGKWSRISGFCAGIIALFAFAGLVCTALRSSPLSSDPPNRLESAPYGGDTLPGTPVVAGKDGRPAKKLSGSMRNRLGNACVAGFALGSPLLFLLGNLTIYNEAIIWGLALSLAALFFALRAQEANGDALTCSLLGFSLCGAGALLSRITFGMPFILISPLLGMRIQRKNRIVNFTALLLPLAAGLLFQVLLNFAKFGSFTGATYDFYIDSVHREFAQKHGIFNLNRVPYSFADYFSLAPPSFHLQPPFLRVDRHWLANSAPFSLPFSETFLSVPWCSSWLVSGAIVGTVLLVRSSRTDYFQRWVAAALFAQFICILSYFALAQRYAADLYPLIIFCFLVFLSAGGMVLMRIRGVVIWLVAISIIINSLATAFWLASDPNLPPETRLFWSRIAGERVTSIK
jgi:hypothetical protein